jgi:hypothetical protein
MDGSRKLSGVSGVLGAFQPLSGCSTCIGELVDLDEVPRRPHPSPRGRPVRPPPSPFISPPPGKSARGPDRRPRSPASGRSFIEGLRPSNSRTRSLASRFAGSLRSRGSHRFARSRLPSRQNLSTSPPPGKSARGPDRRPRSPASGRLAEASQPLCASGTSPGNIARRHGSFAESRRCRRGRH